MINKNDMICLCIFLLILLVFSFFYLDKKITFNSKLITNWTTEKESNFPNEPYIAIHKKNDKILYFLGARHGTKKTMPKTFNLIDLILNKFSIDLIIVESEEINNTKLKKARLNQNESEVLYTISNGKNKNIPIIGGEPSSKFINAVLLKKYNSNELIIFYMIRQLESEINKQNIKREKEMIRFLSNKCFWMVERMPELNLKSVPVANQIKVFFERKMNKKLSVSNLKSNNLAPIKNGNFFQEISHKIIKLRNPHILSQIEKNINKYNSVLIVYEQGHSTEMQPSIVNMMDFKEFILDKKGSLDDK